MFPDPDPDDPDFNFPVWIVLCLINLSILIAVLRYCWTHHS